MKDSDIQWAYIIDPQATVFTCSTCIRGRSSTRHVGDMTFDAVPNFEILECGASFERCHHYAWKHFPELEGDTQRSNLNTAQYLGLEPLEELDSAFAVIVDGARYTRTGSGFNGGYALRFPDLRREVSSPRPRAWYESVKTANGKTRCLPVARVIQGREREPYPGVTWVFPPTKVNPAETLRTA